MHNSCLCIIQFTCDVFKGVSMSLRLKCVFPRQNISRKTECVLLLNAVYKLLHVKLRNIACFLSY